MFLQGFNILDCTAKLERISGVKIKKIIWNKNKNYKKVFSRALTSLHSLLKKPPNKMRRFSSQVSGKY